MSSEFKKIEKKNFFCKKKKKSKARGVGRSRRKNFYFCRMESFHFWEAPFLMQGYKFQELKTNKHKGQYSDWAVKSEEELALLPEEIRQKLPKTLPKIPSFRLGSLDDPVFFPFGLSKMQNTGEDAKKEEVNSNFSYNLDVEVPYHSQPQHPNSRGMKGLDDVTWDAVVDANSRWFKRKFTAGEREDKFRDNHINRPPNDVEKAQRFDPLKNEPKIRLKANPNSCVFLLYTDTITTPEGKKIIRGKQIKKHASLMKRPFFGFCEFNFKGVYQMNKIYGPLLYSTTVYITKFRNKSGPESFGEYGVQIDGEVDLDNLDQEEAADPSDESQAHGTTKATVFQDHADEDEDAGTVDQEEGEGDKTHQPGAPSSDPETPNELKKEALKKLNEGVSSISATLGQKRGRGIAEASVKPAKKPRSSAIDEFRRLQGDDE